MDLILAALLQAVALTALSAVKGDPIDLGYVGAVIAASAALAGGLALVASRLPAAARFAMPVWVGASLAPFTGMGPVYGLATGVVATGVSWVASRSLEASSASRGVVFGTAIFSAIAVGPAVAKRLPLESEAWQPVLQIFALGLSLLIGSAAARCRPKVGIAVCMSGVVSFVLLGFVVRPAAIRWPADSDSPHSDAPSVLLLVLDTVRADRLSIYGHSRRTTPELEALAERYPNVRVISSAHSNGTWTPPSHASLFTGLLPSQHGIHARALMGPGGPRNATMQAERTLAEMLRERGYRTGCIYANSWFDHLSDLGRGFDVFRRPRNPTPIPVLAETLRAWLLPDLFELATSARARAAHVNDELVGLLDACLEPGPCFAVANYMDAHAPYRPLSRDRELFVDPGDPREMRSPRFGDSADRLRKISNLYEAEIHGLDRELGRLFRRLESRGWMDDLWLIVTADHGEALAEHREVEHGTSVYAEVTRVPLVVKPPRGIELSSRKGAVSLVDVATTIAAVGGVDGFGNGSDLRSFEPHTQRIELFENWHRRRERQPGGKSGDPARAVIDGSWKLTDHNGVMELFDLSHDPAERVDLARSHQEIVTELEALLTDVTAPAHAEPAPSIEMTREQADQLRELGYID